MWKEQFYYDYAFVVHNFLTLQECSDYIAFAEQIGFAEAPITTQAGPVMRKDIRNNSRLMIDDTSLAGNLWTRAREWVPNPWRNRAPIGLNERFRFYRYEPGQTFAKHYDGEFRRENGEVSEFTFLIYLNDDFVGGNTSFFKPSRFTVAPKAGSLLLFQHQQLHSGDIVESGIKYVLRSDVMYEADKERT